MKSLIIIVTAAALHAELFVPDRQYRFCKPELPECPAPDIVTQLPEPKNRQPGKGRTPLDEVEGNGYRMAFVEYRDSGERWDNVQLEAARITIERARRRNRAAGGPIHLIMFVHGWANNADKAPGKEKRDVERFQDYLQHYVTQLREDDWPVVGIYFAWHGRSLNLNHGLHTPSFWTRSAAAQRVGRGKLYEDFRCLVNLGTYDFAGGVKPDSGCAALTPFEPVPHVEDSTRSRVIIMGHSFGARVLESALIGAEPSRGTVAGVCKTLLQHQAERPPVDLILFENAATSARLIRRQFTSCQPCGRGRTGCSDFAAQPPRDFADSVMVRPWAFDKSFCSKPQNRKEPQCQPYPLLVSISGKRDLLTRFLLPIASGHIPAAFLPWLETHKLVEVPAQHPDADPDKEEVLVFEACDKMVNNVCQGKRSYLMQRKRTGSVAPVNPVWTMAVPGHVIGSHGDVWNHGYLNLQLNLLALPSQPVPAQPQQQYKGQSAGQKRVRIQ